LLPSLGGKILLKIFAIFQGKWWFKTLDKHYILCYLYPYPQDNVVFAMNCPYCDYADCKVIDSRDAGDGIRRRRQCLKCGARFTTYERLHPGSLFVIKKDGRREEFDSAKLLTGLRKACEKRPLPTGTVDKLADDTEAELYRQGRAEVPASAIGDMVMERLKGLDHIAYIRFASVYRDFTDITTLKREVDTLLDGEVSPPPGQLPLLPEEELTAGTRGRRKRQR
jgi:transcriptional repressor NrdR